MSHKSLIIGTSITIPSTVVLCLLFSIQSYWTGFLKVSLSHYPCHAPEHFSKITSFSLVSNVPQVWNKVPMQLNNLLFEVLSYQLSIFLKRLGRFQTSCPPEGCNFFLAEYPHMPASAGTFKRSWLDLRFQFWDREFSNCINIRNPRQKFHIPGVESGWSEAPGGRYSVTTESG